MHDRPPPFEIGRGIVVRDGADVCLLSTGAILSTAVGAGELLAARGISARVVSMHTVKPLDYALLEDAVERYPLVATIEEHSRIGGFGSAVAEWLSDRGPTTTRLVRIGTPDLFPHGALPEEYLRERFGLTPAAIAGQVVAALDAVGAAG